MKEYTLNLTDIFSKGLRRFGKSNRRSPELAECFNVHPRVGIEPVDPITLPFVERSPDVNVEKSENWAYDSGWIPILPGFVHDRDAASTDVLCTSKPISTIKAGYSYDVTITIADLSSGSWQVELYNSFGTSRSAPGTYTETIVAGSSGKIGIHPTADSKGLLTYFSIKPAGLTEEWPFPQLFRGREVTLLCNKTSIYTVDEGTWSTALITTYDVQNKSDEKSITAGDSWHFMDFGTVWFLYNGSCTVMKPYADGMFNTVQKVLVDDSVTIKTGVEFRGRAVWGGFDPSAFWSTEWESFFDYYRDKFQLPIDDSITFNENVVMWSSIGGGDLLWFYYPVLMTEGLLESAKGHDTFTEPLIMEMLRRNEFGFMPMEWQGTVYMIKELGKGLVVYGENGVSLLYPVQEPFPTFGMKTLSKVGIANRSAVGGDSSHHLFLNSKGELYIINSNYEIERVDYSEFLSTLLGEDVIISHEPTYDLFYISDGTVCYVLSSRGLHEVDQFVSSVVIADGAPIGTYISGGDNEGRAYTDTIDNDISGIKRCHSIEIDSNSSGTIQVALQYRMTRGASFTTSSWVTLSDLGTAYIGIAYIECRVLIKATNYTDLDFDNVRLKWNLIDKRFVRGQYAN